MIKIPSTWGNNKLCEIAEGCSCWRGVLWERMCESNDVWVCGIRQLTTDGLPQWSLCRYLYVNSCWGSDGSSLDDSRGVVEQTAWIWLQDRSFTERDGKAFSKVTLEYCHPQVLNFSKWQLTWGTRYWTWPDPEVLLKEPLKWSVWLGKL